MNALPRLATSPRHGARFIRAQFVAKICDLSRKVAISVAFGGFGRRFSHLQATAFVVADRVLDRFAVLKVESQA
jgi:hypothetical protein